MHITELLVTAYDGDEPVLAINLGPESATVALTGKTGDGQTVVESAWSQGSEVFAAVRQLIETLAAAPVH
jgi:hypothetical protein